ncbi:MAG TPA: hypothetical protein VMR95_01685 [Candidatus Binatia bacterium]|nr:hypothetical protein [Candidatus Binatia bacterium]
MALFTSPSELSRLLTDQLLLNGRLQIDQIRITRSSPVVGELVLNDYWSGFHKRFPRGTEQDNRIRFYEEGNIGVLGIRQTEPQLSTFVFRPSDISLEGMGKYLTKHLPTELQQSDEVIVTRAGTLVSEPQQDMEVIHIASVLLDHKS